MNNTLTELERAKRTLRDAIDRDWSPREIEILRNEIKELEPKVLCVKNTGPVPTYTRIYGMQKLPQEIRDRGPVEFCKGMIQVLIKWMDNKDYVWINAYKRDLCEKELNYFIQ
jgi:hypothetical protein